MTERLLRCTRVEPRTVGGQHVVANSSHKRTANRSGRHSHSQQAQSEPNRARDIGPRMLTSQPSAYLMTMELHRRRRASRGQSKPFDEMRLSTCRGARSTAAAQRQSAEGSRSTAGSSQRARPSNWRAESHHARMLQNRHRGSSHKLGPECQISVGKSKSGSACLFPPRFTRFSKEYTAI